TGLAEVPVDDRELTLMFRGLSKDFQDVTVQGVVAYRVADASRLAARVDFTIDPETGVHTGKPLEKLAGMLTQLGQQSALDYLSQTELAVILERGVESVRERIEQGLSSGGALADMGLSLVWVRVSSVRPEPEVEKALRTRVREAIQQQADEAQFQRRALAVEKERAIQENEMQNQIELARREELLIRQQGENQLQRVGAENESKRLASTGAAERVRIEADGEAARVKAVEEARVVAERDRMAIYREFPADRLLGLAAQELAAKLQKIENLNVTPDLLGMVLSTLKNGVQAPGSPTRKEA
ncbi:MAG: hypothetical protein K2Q20_15690, partial [Phycisphaerales bacterium]|nr:hypothetical protein [Phycisphaerales bacterium]